MVHSDFVLPKPYSGIARKRLCWNGVLANCAESFCTLHGTGWDGAMYREPVCSFSVNTKGFCL